MDHKNKNQWSRREVLAGAAVGAGAAVLPLGLTGCGDDELESPPPPVDESQNLVLPEAVVSVAQSGASSAFDLDDDAVDALVREAIGLAGGLAAIVSDGDVVVLKPNLITTYDYSANPATLAMEANGITTDRRIVRTLSAMVRELNPSGSILVMEGVADDNTAHNMGVLGYDAEYFPDVDELIAIEDASGGWHEYDSPLLKAMEVPGGKARYPDSMKPNESPEFYLNRVYAEADVVISIPCLKTHANSTITGAVKNVGIGATPTSIYGGDEDDNHRFINGVINHDYDHLQEFIHDFFLCRPVDFVVMDGLQGIKNGPVGTAASDTIADDQMNMRLILAGPDAVALDSVAALIMGYSPAEIELLQWLEESEGGVGYPPVIRVAGVQVDDVRTFFEVWGSHAEDDRNEDTEAPSLTVHSAEVDGAALVLDAELGATGRLEIALDGVRDGRILLDGFEEIVLDISQLEPGEHTVTVIGYDDQLNSRAEERTITV